MRIVGGVEAVPFSWPSMVLFGFVFEEAIFVDETTSVDVNQVDICGGINIIR